MAVRCGPWVDIFMEIEKRFEENKESLGGPLINDEH
jgi:hypothetical protein